MNWILAFVGLSVIFLSKYQNRSTKTKPNFNYWINDNWVELVQGMLVTFLFMFVLQLTTFNNDSFSEWFFSLLNKVFKFETPPDVILPAKEVISVLIGWGATGVVYWLNRRKSKWAVKKEV